MIDEQIRAMTEAALRALPKVGIAIVVLFVFVIIGMIVSKAVRFGSGRIDRDQHPFLAKVLGRLVQLAVRIAGLLIALSIVFPSLTPGHLVQLLGISGVAIGFAFRDIFQNFLAGLLLLITRPFLIGDQIVFAGEEGTVEDIQTRATLIRTYDGRRIVIPNANLFTSPVVVNTAYPSRRMEYDFEIHRGLEVDRVRSDVAQAIRDHAGVLPDPAPDVLLVDLTANGVKLRARWWIEPPRKEDAIESRSRVLTAIRTTLIALMPPPVPATPPASAPASAPAPAAAPGPSPAARPT
ncbi:MAG TPA: mechanosensitive ion channel family protein [Planctomycetota bacterium]|nr:mechanosensitive ion channel family protein [Planctomycetota bacterium]